jgi:methyltransferase (TIGR00027 family)
MLPGQPSRTLLRAAIRRAAHQLFDQPLIFNDPIVVHLVPEASDQTNRDRVEDPGTPDGKLFRLWFATRMRFAEDRLAQAATRGVRQYVILGAGLDTFPWRQPDFATTMQIFVADHPSSLVWTQSRLRERGLSRPSNLNFVPVDFEAQHLEVQLAACGFDSTLATFCSALGVTQYLSHGSVDALLGFVAGLSHDSEIVFSFAPPDDELSRADLETVTKSAARTAALGEPWKSRLRPAELIERLKQLGFREIFHLTPELARQRYFAEHQPAARAPGWEQVMAAVI